MKKAFLALAAVALLFATSCKKESVNPAIDVPEGSFLATIDNGANPQNAPVVKDGMGTMTTIDANNFVIWETGDEISINGSTYTTTSTPGNTVVFSGGNATGSTFHAFFPASIAGTDNAGTLPATQTIEFDNQGNAKVTNLPMYATSNNNQLTFHNICAALKITVPVACDSIVISADENIRGEFTVDATTFAAQLAGTGEHLGKSLKIVKDQDGSFAKNEVAYVAVPGNTYTNFTVKFYDDAYIVGQKSLASLTVEANKVYNVNIPTMALCFTARNGSMTVTFNIKNATHQIQYSTDGTNWQNYTSGTGIQLAQDAKVYFQAATNQTTATAFGNSGVAKRSNFIFSGTGTVEASGNIMSLYGPDCPNITLPEYAFCGLFANCSTLVKAPELPATTSAYFCYQSMFESCINLTTAPALPATTLAEYCYWDMFKNCTSLTSVTMMATTVSKTNSFTDWLKNAGINVTKTANTHKVHVASGMASNQIITFVLSNYSGDQSHRWTATED